MADGEKRLRCCASRAFWSKLSRDIEAFRDFLSADIQYLNFRIFGRLLFTR